MFELALTTITFHLAVRKQVCKVCLSHTGVGLHACPLRRDPLPHLLFPPLSPWRSPATVGLVVAEQHTGKCSLRIRDLSPNIFCLLTAPPHWAASNTLSPASFFPPSPLTSSAVPTWDRCPSSVSLPQAPCHRGVARQDWMTFMDDKR